MNRFLKKLGKYLLCIAVLVPLLVIQPAFAQPAPNDDDCSTASEGNNGKPGGKEICTNFACLQKKANDGKPGLLTNITDKLKEVLGESTKKLYEAFTKSGSYKAAVNAAAVLMVVIYGVAFMIGVVQPSYGQILIRFIKLGIIFTLISPTGWDFFNGIAVKFFNDGTDELIRGVISIGTGTEVKPGDSPFLQLDGLAKWVLSPDMIIAMLSVTFASGPYGLAMGGLMAFAFGGVVKLLVDALRIYGTSFIMRSLLLGIAPIFVVFLLFDRTKQLFTGWLNSLINLSLQPILFFTFISFFYVMILSAATDMLIPGGASQNANESGGAAETKNKSIEFCWAEGPGPSGAQNKVSFWRVKFPGDNNPMNERFDWKGPISCFLGVDKDACKKSFPVNIVDILSFLILIYIAQGFSKIVPQLASEISSAFVNLDTQSKLDLGQKQAAAAGGGGSVNAPAAGQKKTDADGGTIRKTP